MEHPINKETITQVYSGKPGCCCGCRGKHSYSSKYPTKHDYDTVNDSAVTRIVNLMNKRLSEVKDESNHYFLEVHSEYTGEVSRWYIAYKA